MLQLIKVFEGSFGGPTLYENPQYITPNAVRVCVFVGGGGEEKGEGLSGERLVSMVSSVWGPK